MLSGGDYFKTDVCPNNFGGNTELANCDLSTLLNIGAEAEKRREDEFQKMMCNLEQVAKNNKLLHYDIRRKNAIIDSLKSQIDENNAIICNLKSEINKFKQKYIEAKNCNNYLYSMQPEIESMKAENNRLEQELEQLTWEYCEFQKSHSECPTEQENQNRINTINHFKKLIADAKKQIDASKQKINCLTETNEKLQKRICFISNEMKQICQKQVEKIKSYDDIICKLQIQLKN
uniref:Synaptonemal complex protein 1-like protein isoform x1 n=1 Tax=Triatoma infestans TaxID=30076 RepID=A0A161MZ98_TRIIF